ncbi:hypothetical protein M432DRAFT_594058 [Thermoascus aurantiacus ATCC 26904]
MLFSKAILLLSAAVAPFALAADTASPLPAAHTITVQVINATEPTPTPSPSSTPVSTPLLTPSFTPSSTPVIYSSSTTLIKATGTGGVAAPTGGRWNTTTPASPTVKAPAGSPSAPPLTGGAVSGREVTSAMMAGVVAVAALVVL